MPQARSANRKFPWLPLVILVAGIILFWVVPAVRGPVKVEVVPSQSSKSR